MREQKRRPSSGSSVGTGTYQVGAMGDYCSRSWADIPQELLEAIASRASLIGQIRCGAFCKKWNQLLMKQFGAAYGSLPWLMLYKKSPEEHAYKLYDPLYQKTYPLRLENLDDIKIGSAVGFEFLGSKNGWVVFEWGRQFATYNLFTHEVVKFPRLDEPIDYIGKATFSSNPNSADCLFFAIHFLDNSSGYSSTFGICMCRRGDEAWKTTKIGEMGTDISTWGMIYLDGNLYCLFQYGSFGVFHVDTQEWRLLVDRSWREALNEGDAVLLERDRELLCIYDDDWGLVRFDFDQMDWVKQEAGMEDIAVFLGGKSCLWIPAKGEAREFAGTVNYYNYQYYCYKIGGGFLSPRHHSYSEIYSNILEFEKVEDGAKWKEMWITPPQLCQLI